MRRIKQFFRWLRLKMGRFTCRILGHKALIFTNWLTVEDRDGRYVMLPYLCFRCDAVVWRWHREGAEEYKKYKDCCLLISEVENRDGKLMRVLKLNMGPEA